MHPIKYFLFVFSFMAFYPIESFADILPNKTTDTLTVSDSIKKIYTRPLFYGKGQQKLDRFTSSEWFKMTATPITLILGSIAIEGVKEPFNDLRNAYIPDFRNKYDDYLQYVPAAALLGMKIAGVKSRSSWGRMLTADVTSVAIMAALVNGIKYTVKSQRPNNGSYNSYPSGHTATAFMIASLFHKEYGVRSPWYSVAGYSLATITGYSRLINNRHWMSDVMVGAGIGILSTELGYWITGLIFKSKGLQLKGYYQASIPDRTPSFVGLYNGFTFMPDLKLDESLVFRSSAGASTGIEGAWFINDYVGVGGKAIIGHVPMQLQMNETFSTYLPGTSTEVMEDGTDLATANIGAYFDLALSYRWSIGAKLLAGYTFADAQTLYLTADNAMTQIPFLKLKEIHASDFGTGFSISYWVREMMGVRLFFDYNLTPANYRYYYADKPETIIHRHKNLSSYTVGASINVFL